MARINQFSKEAKVVDSLRPIAENPRFAEATEKLAKFQGELRGLREAVDRENAAWYAKQSSSIDEDAIGRADRMLDGQNLADDRDTQTKLRELEKKIAILRPAIGKQQELVDRIRGELSLEAGRLVQDRHRKALVKILDAARALLSAANAERRVRRELLDLGYEVVESVVPAPRLATPLILGDESFYDSAIANFARQLKDLGISP
jgi:hypothetical protein